MIAPNLLMTNNHVIKTQEVVEKSNFSFNYQLDINGKECPTQIIGASPNGVFYTNEQLDYTVLTLKEVPDFGKPLIFKSKLMRQDDRVAIIQHPGGHLKKISIQNNFVVYADNQVLQYTTSTEPGSSASPVFDDDFQVVGIHHSGGMLVEPNTQQRYLRNARTSAIALLNDLKSNAPEIYNSFGEIVSPDEQIIASGSPSVGDNGVSNPPIKLWNTSTGEEIRILTGHTASVNAITFSLTAKIIASGGEDNTIRIWNYQTGELIQTLEPQMFGKFSCFQSSCQNFS
ncbi:trypsin-like peptidase domain-containing protein [Nostoc sp.]|uniref:trypsin-like peptidase domain-containing protein n=1 Tax=Nostoc sp. TaxID=1180 RepID=UPI002FF69418